MKKSYVFIPLILILILLFLSGCTSGSDTEATPTTEPTATAEPTDTAEPAAADTTSDELVLTLDELAQYDGQDGNPAYIAVDGVIYDVTNVSQWSSGEHNGYNAGNDLTSEIKTVSPHGVSKLVGITVVGKLAD